MEFNDYRNDDLLEKINDIIANGTDPSYQNSRIIRELANYGHTEIIKVLMLDSRIDPSAVGNYAIINAFTHGHLDTVRLFLNDRRVIDGNIVQYTDYNHLNDTIFYLREKNKIYDELTEDEKTYIKLKWDI